jgi:hypothetical protein
VETLAVVPAVVDSVTVVVVAAAAAALEEDSSTFRTYVFAFSLDYKRHRWPRHFELTFGSSLSMLAGKI